MGTGLIKVVDDFLKDFEWVRSWMDTLDYEMVQNPADGVSYPGISTQIPVGVSADIISRLQAEIGKKIAKVTLFARLTPEGVGVPHMAHNDSCMGSYAMVLYMNRAEHCAGGTSFVRHKALGMECAITSQEQLEAWERDTNDLSAWEVLSTVDMRPNRALIFDGNLMHMASAPSAFGSSAIDGRLVIACFFEVFND